MTINEIVAIIVMITVVGVVLWDMHKNGVPDETRSFVETSGVRIGVAAETTRGHDEKWFRELAVRMIAILRNGK